MKGNHKTLFIVFSLIITLLLIASIGINALSIIKINENNSAINTYFGTAEDTPKEDDVTIGGRYVIKSTKAISDAYISGNSSSLSDKDKETLEMAENVIKKIIKEGMSDYKKEKAVYLYLVKTLSGSEDVLNVISTATTENSDPHDVLKNKSAVCVGYATTFRMFMQMLGIECKVVHSSDLTHSWDLVKLDDGWYHTDCYMDSSSSTYGNFNMNDTMCSINHAWTKENYPAADGVKYNYVLKNAKELSDVTKMPDYVAKMINEGKTLISCSFDSLSEKEQRKASYIGDSLTSALSGEERSLTIQWTRSSDEEFVAIVNVTYYEEEEQLDEGLYEEIDELVSKAVEKYGLQTEYYDDFEPTEYFVDETKINSAKG